MNEKDKDKIIKKLENVNPKDFVLIDKTLNSLLSSQIIKKNKNIITSSLQKEVITKSV